MNNRESNIKKLKREGKIALCKCPLTHNTYGVRFEKIGSSWRYDWAFSISPKAAMRERYDETKIVGDIAMGNGYPGCPYCESKFFIICECGHLNCYNVKGNRFTCEWCKQEGILSGEYTGSGISSGGDL